MKIGIMLRPYGVQRKLDEVGHGFDYRLDYYFVIFYYTDVYLKQERSQVANIRWATGGPTIFLGGLLNEGIKHTKNLP
jgi:hypothetical protein